MKLKSFVLSLPILLLLTTYCVAEDFEKTPKIILNGEASIQKEADQMGSKSWSGDERKRLWRCSDPK